MEGNNSLPESIKIGEIEEITKNPEESHEDQQDVIKLEAELDKKLGLNENEEYVKITINY
jgi:hypothetical protein